MDLEEAILSSDNPVVMISNHDNSDNILSQLNDLSRKHQNFEGEEIVLIGTRDERAGLCVLQTLSQHFISLYRHHSMAANQRQTVLSHGNHLLVVQLCLAERNKQKFDDFEVDISEVILASKKIIKQKLSPVKESCPSNEGRPGVTHFPEPANEIAELDKLMNMYEGMLKRCNMVDLVDVFSRVGNHIRERRKLSSEEMNGQETKNRKYVILQLPENEIEKMMLRALAGPRGSSAVSLLSIQSDSRGCSSSPDAVPNDFQVNWASPETRDLAEISPGDLLYLSPSCPKTPSAKSATEVFSRRLILAHLALLINTRDEMSLARCLSLPGKGMDIEGFTALRKAAREKSMPMYQTMISFIMKLRLGGKSYAPDLSSPLGAHVKPMGEFVDLIQQVQTVAEETADVGEAIRRVLSAIKASLLKAQGSVLRPASVEKTVAALTTESRELLARRAEVREKTPKKIVGQGRVIYGQKTLDIVRSIVDHGSGAYMSDLCQTQMLTDTLTSQKTPVKLPSIISQFRTPPTVEPEPELLENVSLRERLRESLGESSDKSKVNFKLWAEPDDVKSAEKHPPPQQEEVGGVKTLTPDLIDSIVATPTLKRALAMHSPCAREQENEPANQARGKNVPANWARGKIQKGKAASKKRLILGEMRSEEASQPAKRAKMSAPKPRKKKDIPLAKGQKTLTHFFRV